MYNLGFSIHTASFIILTSTSLCSLLNNPSISDVGVGTSLELADLVGISVGNNHWRFGVSVSLFLFLLCASLKSDRHFSVASSNFSLNLGRSYSVLLRLMLSMRGGNISGSPVGIPSMTLIPLFPSGSHFSLEDHFL